MATVPTLDRLLAYRELLKLAPSVSRWRVEDEGTEHVRLIADGYPAGMSALIEYVNDVAETKGIVPRRASYAMQLPGMEISANHQWRGNYLNSSVTMLADGQAPVTRPVRPTMATLGGTHLPEEEIGDRAEFRLGDRSVIFVREAVSDEILVQNDREPEMPPEYGVAVFHGPETLRILADMDIPFHGFEKYRTEAPPALPGKQTQRLLEHRERLQITDGKS